MIRFQTKNQFSDGRKCVCPGFMIFQPNESAANFRQIQRCSSLKLKTGRKSHCATDQNS